MLRWSTGVLPLEAEDEAITQPKQDPINLLLDLFGIGTMKSLKLNGT
jgi:hypothetical protein